MFRFDVYCEIDQKKRQMREHFEELAFIGKKLRGIVCFFHPSLKQVYRCLDGYIGKEIQSISNEITELEKIKYDDEGLESMGLLDDIIASGMRVIVIDENSFPNNFEIEVEEIEEKECSICGLDDMDENTIEDMEMFYCPRRGKTICEMCWNDTRDTAECSECFLAKNCILYDEYKIFKEENADL